MKHKYTKYTTHWMSIESNSEKNGLVNSTVAISIYFRDFKHKQISLCATIFLWLLFNHTNNKECVYCLFGNRARACSCVI